MAKRLIEQKNKHEISDSNFTQAMANLRAFKIRYQIDPSVTVYRMVIKPLPLQTRTINPSIPIKTPSLPGVLIIEFLKVNTKSLVTIVNPWILNPAKDLWGELQDSGQSRDVLYYHGWLVAQPPA